VGSGTRRGPKKTEKERCLYHERRSARQCF
jgi:hypothetical protein